MDDRTLAYLKQALLEVQIQELEEILALYPDDIPVSRKHKRAMRRILRDRRRAARNRIIAIVVAAALTLLVGCSVYANRRRIADFIEELFDTHSKVLTFDDSNGKEQIEEEYTLTFVPEGYVLESNTANPLFCIEYWVKDSQKIIFEQQLLSTYNFYDTEHSEDYQLITMGTIEFYFRVSVGNYQYLWTDGNYFYILQFDENFSQEVVKQIIDGIKIKL